MKLVALGGLQMHVILEGTPAELRALAPLLMQDVVVIAAARDLPDNDAAALWARVDAQRKARGMSLRGLAKELGVSSATFCRWSHGKSPSASMLYVATKWLRDGG